MTETQGKTLGLSKDEIELYDRQIRLWGLSAQQRMRSSKVLLYNLGGCGTEITKNLVLSGIGSLTIYDKHLLSEDDFFNQFFISKDDQLGVARLVSAKARIQDMNPRVEIDCVHDRDLLEDLDVLKNFDIVIVTECNSYDDIVKINEKSREFQKPFYLCGGNGMSGYCFIDLIEFISLDEKLKNGSFSTQQKKISFHREIVEVIERIDEEDGGKIYEQIKTKNTFPRFSDFLELNPELLPKQMSNRQLKKLTNVLPLTIANFKTAAESAISEEYAREISSALGLPSDSYIITTESIRDFNRQKNVEFPPVNAIVGGAVAQDVINVLGKQESPLNNFIIFDGNTLEMLIFEL